MVSLTVWYLRVQWEVEPWGSWRLFAKNQQYEAIVEASCSHPGTPLRAPTADKGLDIFCRDSFFGEVRDWRPMQCAAVLLRRLRGTQQRLCKRKIAWSQSCAAAECILACFYCMAQGGVLL
jgi:hypothetical protein